MSQGLEIIKTNFLCVIYVHHFCFLWGLRDQIRWRTHDLEVGAAETEGHEGELSPSDVM